MRQTFAFRPLNPSKSTTHRENKMKRMNTTDYSTAQPQKRQTSNNAIFTCEEVINVQSARSNQYVTWFI